jgi:CubicO group peptidase (beta-lactamase class C family)
MEVSMKFMLALTALVLPILALPVAPLPVPTVKPEDVGLSSERLALIDRMIERRIAAGDIAGAVTIVARNGKVAHHSAKGVVDLESKQPMRTSTMFRIASMTKPVTGVAIMMLVEEGKLRLSDPVSRYIPEFKGQKVAVAAPGAADGARGARGGQNAAPPQFTTVAATREITIKDLLTHVSGLGSNISLVLEEPRWSFSQGPAGHTVQERDSKPWGVLSRSLPVFHSISSSASASSIHSE